MEGFNGFFLERENGKKLKLVTDFKVNKREYLLFEDGNFYYEQNGKAVMLDKTNPEDKKIIEKALRSLKSPLMDVIGIDKQRQKSSDSKRILVDELPKL